jgi:hypothetical protein
MTCLLLGFGSEAKQGFEVRSGTSPFKHLSLARKSNNKGRLKIDHVFAAVKKIETTFVREIRTTQEDEELGYDDNGPSI